jgi:hypothetical protein
MVGPPLGGDDLLEAVRKPVFRPVEEDHDRREDRPRRHVFSIALRQRDVGSDADLRPAVRLDHRIDQPHRLHILGRFLACRVIPDPADVRINGIAARFAL